MHHVLEFQTLIAHCIIASVTIFGFYLQWRRDRRRERRQQERHVELKSYLNGKAPRDRSEV